MSDSSTPVAGLSGNSIHCKERRASVRTASMMEASYHPITVSAVGPSCPAIIWYISLGGVALIVPHPYESGSMLAVVPEVLPQSLSPALEARVLRVAPHGDGLWMASCEFVTPMTEDELRALLY